MDDHVLPGDEAYADPVGAGRRRRTIDQKTFAKPIKSIGLRRSAILAQSATVADAIDAMRAAKIGSVLVTDSSGRLVGILTERDLLNRAAKGEVDPKTTGIQAIMRSKPETLKPDDAIAYALRIMSHGGCRHVPLVDADGRPVGVVSVRDIVDFIADLFPDDILTLPTDPRSTFAKNPEGA